MSDISDKVRTFKVHFDKNVVGCDAEYEEIVVPAGEDADALCAEVLQDMINNSCDSSWFEKGGDEDE